MHRGWWYPTKNLEALHCNQRPECSQSSLHFSTLGTSYYMTSQHMTKSSRPSVFVSHIMEAVVEVFRTRLLNITLSMHPIFFSSQYSNQIKEKRLQAALAQNLYTFPSLEKEGVLSSARQPLYHCYFPLSVFLLCFQSNRRKRRIGLLLPCQPLTSNKCSVILLTAFTFCDVYTYNQSCQSTQILTIIHCIPIWQPRSQAPPSFLSFVVWKSDFSFVHGESLGMRLPMWIVLSSLHPYQSYAVSFPGLHPSFLSTVFGGGFL